jgi:hypothetical protein
LAFLVITVLESMHMLFPVLRIVPDINGLIRTDRLPGLLFGGNIPSFPGHFHYPVVHVKTLGANLGNTGYSGEAINKFLRRKFGVRRFVYSAGIIDSLTALSPFATDFPDISSNNNHLHLQSL